MIVKSDCGTDGSFYNTIHNTGAARPGRWRRYWTEPSVFQMRQLCSGIRTMIVIYVTPIGISIGLMIG